MSYNVWGLYLEGVILSELVGVSDEEIISKFSKRYFCFNSRITTRIMPFGMGIFEHLIKIITCHMTEKIKSRFFEKLHYIMMNVSPNRTFSQVINTLPSIIVVFRCSPISEGCLFDSPFLKFCD